MSPSRLSIVTYNLWNTQRWPERQPALQEFLQRFQPDILCIQELRAETRDFLDKAMPTHARVEDPFAGWTVEGNIYWNRDLFDVASYGAEDIGILEEWRRLFWVRLQVRETGRPMLVSTAHYTYQGHERERATGQSPRLEQARRTVAALETLAHPDEAIFFMGDLNDPVHPMATLFEAGYLSCFAALNLLPPPTWPAHPTAGLPPGQRITNQTIDWIFANRHARPLAAQVPQLYYGDISPSDHWPVLAIYELVDNQGNQRHDQ